MSEPNGTFAWRLDVAERSISRIQENYVNKEQFNEFKLHMDNEFQSVRTDVRGLRNALMTAALSVTVSAVLFALTIFMIVKP